MRKLFKNAYALIVIGVLCLMLAYQSSSREIVCNGAQMKPGETCGDLTYEQKERGGAIVTWGLIGLGLVLVAIGFARRPKKKK